MPMTIGTNYFVSRSAAISFYYAYGYDSIEVDRRIKEGDIHIGEPPTKPGETIIRVDGGKRYAIIEEQKK